MRNKDFRSGQNNGTCEGNSEGHGNKYFRSGQNNGSCEVSSEGHGNNETIRQGQ